MLNLHELEKRWFRYKVKLFLPYIFITLLIIVILTYNLFRTKNEESHNTTSIAKNKIMPISQTKENNTTPMRIVSQKKLPIEANNKKEDKSLHVTLSPSMNFLNNFKIKKQTSTYQIKKPIIEPSKKIKNKVKRVQTTHSIKKENIISSITIVREDTKKDIQNILQRFQKDKNPALSLFLAKKYYEIGDYQKAYNYALITNKMNKTIEGSWLIFAKSLVKLNQKDKAIKILSRYIKNTHSDNADILLQEIQSGAFK